MKRFILLSWSSALLISGAMASTPPGQLLSSLPLRFEENRSDFGAHDVTYVAHGGSFNLILRPTESWLQTPVGSLRMALRGANSGARMEALDRLPGAVNYFLGNKNWKTGVTGYGRIRSSHVYAGIDLVFHGEGGRLEYDFIVAPHADPNSIRLEFSGEQGLRVDAAGDLIIGTGPGQICWKRPEIYQDIDARRIPVAGSFVVSKNEARFHVAAYDRNHQLVIDPALSYSTFLGGNRNEGVRGIAVDGSGNVYVVGNTTTMNLPTTPGVVQPNFAGETSSYMKGDAMLAKFSPTGALVYLTYLGGTADDTASAVAVDAAGNAYITGCTTSTDFPTAGTPFQPHFAGSGGQAILVFGDAFVAKLDPTGSALIYSTYLGGEADDFGAAIAIDSAGNAYVAGGTRSYQFPVTSGAYQPRLAGVGGEPLKSCCNLPLLDPGDAFVTKLNPTGSQLIFSTYVGGTLDDVALAIAVDATNNVYIGGYTISTNFPTTTGAYQRTFGGSEQQNEFFIFGDGFITKLNPSGTALVYSTYFGGYGDDNVTSLAIDAAGNAYLTGSTSTPNWQTSAGAFQPAYGGYGILPYTIEQLVGDAYVAKLNPTGTALLYMSYLGGNANDGGTGIAIDSAGNAYVTGFSDSTNFPVTANALQPKWAGDGGQPGGSYFDYGDAFLSVVNPQATALIYSSYFGGRFDDGAMGIALDSFGAAHIGGFTISYNFPVTLNAAQKTYGGIDQFTGWAKGDAFIATFSGLLPGVPGIAAVVNAESGVPIVAPNTWVVLTGSGLAPDTRAWQSSDFVNNQLPTALDGVSVTMNGEKAFVYYISGDQINILTPPDLAPGVVSVQVNNNGATGEFSVQAQTLSESFFLFNGGPYIAATHANGSLIGPTSLYPGASTPAKPGETILVYANGFGSTTVPVVSGSVTQSGSLPALPDVTIGGTSATLTFAGLISPGLYQFNVVVPSSAAGGDNPIQAAYGGQTTPSGTLITIQ